MGDDLPNSRYGATIAGMRRFVVLAVVVAGFFALATAHLSKGEVILSGHPTRQSSSTVAQGNPFNNVDSRRCGNDAGRNRINALTCWSENVSTIRRGSRSAGTQADTSMWRSVSGHELNELIARR